MAEILVKYDTVSKKITVDNGGLIAGPLSGISFQSCGKNEDGEDIYGCEMSSFSKDKEHDSYKMERVSCSDNDAKLLTAAQELLTKFYNGR